MDVSLEAVIYFAYTVFSWSAARHVTSRQAAM